MNEDILIRIRLIERGPLAKVIANQLLLLKEELPEGAMIEHIEIFIATEGRSGWLASTKTRLLALRRAVEELDRDAATASTPTQQSGTPPRPGRFGATGPVAPMSPGGTAPAGGTAPPELPPIDLAALRIRLRGMSRVTVGVPHLDYALLEDRGDRSFAWIELDKILAIGAERAAIADACQPYAVAAPSWQQIWREHTSATGNPWRSVSDSDFASWFEGPLDVTFGAGGHAYRSPLAAMRAAFDEWQRRDARRLIDLLTAAVAGESRTVDASTGIAGELAALAKRAAIVPGSALVPLVLTQLAGAALVETWPTPRGLWFDVTGASGDRYVRARAIKLGAAAGAWQPVASTPYSGGATRDATLVEAGDTVLLLSTP